MATKNKCNFYIGKGDDGHPWLYYGEEPPIIINGQLCCTQKNALVGTFWRNKLGDSLAGGEIIEVSIRKKNKKK